MSAPFFTRFSVRATHGDLLMANALALAARQELFGVRVSKLDDSTVEVTLPSGRVVVGSDWDNICSALTAPTEMLCTV